MFVVSCGGFVEAVVSSKLDILAARTEKQIPCEDDRKRREDA